MRIYFCGAIMGGRDLVDAYQHVVGRLKSLGHQVLSEHVADAEVLERELTLDARQVYQRDLAWLRDSDAVIAEVSTPSLGVGYEVASALHLGKPVFCIYRAGLPVSKMITGNTSAGISVAAYANHAELDCLIDAFLGSVAAAL